MKEDTFKIDFRDHNVFSQHSSSRGKNNSDKEFSFIKAILATNSYNFCN